MYILQRHTSVTYFLQLGHFSSKNSPPGDQAFKIWACGGHHMLTPFQGIIILIIGGLQRFSPNLWFPPSSLTFTTQKLCMLWHSMGWCMLCGGGGGGAMPVPMCVLVWKPEKDTRYLLGPSRPYSLQIRSLSLAATKPQGSFSLLPTQHWVAAHRQPYPAGAQIWM